MRKMNSRCTAIWRFGMPVMAAFVLASVSGCSVPSIFGSDDSPLPLPPPLEAGDDGVVADNTGRKEKTEAASSEVAGAEPEAEPGADGEYPELADVPEGDAATRTAEKSPEAQTARDQLAKGLIADREQAKYTDEELRGGRVAAVAPPRPAPPAPPRPQPDTSSESKPEPEESAEPEAPAVVARAPEPARPAPAPARPAAATPALAPATRPAAAPPTPPPARTYPPRPATAPPRPATTPQTQAVYSSTAFQPSHAKPLPADLAASLPAGVAQRYQETLRQQVAGVPAGLPVAPIIGGRPGQAYVSIPFAPGSSNLSANDRRTIAQVARSARGGFSRIRVVGHASSTASSQSESERMMVNWEVSQARATAVADELVRQGVDAARIVIEAVGDRQAAYAGGADAEAAARRVDLFLE